MDQVLGNLGTSITEDTNKAREPQAPTSSHSNPVLDLPDMEMLSPKETKQLEPHIEGNSHFEQSKHP